MGTITVLQSRTSQGAAAPGQPIAVTHVITTLSTGGAEIMLYRLLCAMDRSRFCNSVISLGGDGTVAQRIRAAGISVRVLDIRPRQAVTGIVRLARELRRERPRVIQTWMYHADLLGGLASLSLPGVPVVWNIRCGGLDPSIDKHSTIWISRLCTGLSRFLPARIVSCSHSGSNVHVAAGYTRKKMQVIPNGFDTESYRPDRASLLAVRDELGLEAGAILIGAVGRFDRAKDHATLCRTAAIVCGLQPKVHFLICGENITRSNSGLTSLLEAAGIGSRCHLLGRREDIPRIMAALDVFVSSSAVEGFPNAIGEAMACGVPCVATDAGDSRQLIGDTGLIVPVRDAEALAANVLKLIDVGAEGRMALGALARQRISDRFGIAQVARQYEELYQEMAAGCAE
jgi:glycosyltransferase involved in cell wall biosynthesis